jgi:hypothetical protein
VVLFYRSVPIPARKASLLLPPRRDILYVAAFLPTAFVVGISAPRMMSLSNPDPVMIAMWLVGCIALVALIAGYLRYQYKNSTATLRLLTQRAYAQAVGLLGDNFDMLVPHENDTETRRLLVRRVGDAVVVDKETWRDTHHLYTIWPTGLVNREIYGSPLTRADKKWLKQPMTAARLTYLLQALQFTYSPRRRVDV